MSYRKLEIWMRAKELVIDIHQMSLQLPKFEMYETGSQIRRSVKSVRSNIVEGYGRRSYKKEYIRFLIFALASNDETIDHLDTLFETGSLKNEKLYHDLKERLEVLGKMLNNFLQAVSNDYISKK
jgi:four helix bundle protein